MRSWGSEQHLPSTNRVLRNVAYWADSEGLLKGRKIGLTSKVMQRAVSIDESVFGRDHPQIASDLVNLAGVVIDSGDRQTGKSLLRRALVIYETRFGNNSREAAAVRDQIARGGM